jgi:precorrin-2 dehydrogenase / sirohydrochlorin ferrochelatase
MSTRAPKTYYPVFLSLEGRFCLVVGGGSVAEGKVSGLLAAGARVTVVSPVLNSALQELVDAGSLGYVRRGYEPGDIEGMSLVLTATDDHNVNRQVTADCRLRQTWVNSADDPPNCDFILPSVIRRGRVTLAASTAGASPALARRLREDLEAFLGDDFAPLADVLAEARAALQTAHIRVEASAWQGAIDARLRALVAQGRPAEARDHLLARLGHCGQVPASGLGVQATESRECSH